MGVFGAQQYNSLPSYGWYQNGNQNHGNNTNFTWGSYQATGGPDNGPYLQVTGGNGGTAMSTDFIPINDTSANYQIICYVKTFSRDSNNNLAGGHIGMATYNADYQHIDLRNCGGIGNTTLSRPLAVGDDKAYIASNSGWYTGNTYYFKTFCLYPSNSPYNVNYEYTRIGLNTPSGGLYTQDGGPTLTGNGDYEVDLRNSSNSDITMPNLGYGTLATGTAVMNGRAGGSYCYSLGAPNYPETWTQKATGVFTGENRNSGTPFRYKTRYVKFLILRNYNQRTGPNNCVWGISDIFFGRVEGSRTYNNII